MDTVHIRRDDKPTQGPLDTRGNTHVAVVEHRSCVQADFKEQHGQRCCTERHDDKELDTQRQQYLYGMKPRSGCYVHVEVGMVHPVQSPEDGHVMKEAVLEVDREIEQDQCKHRLDPCRQRDQIE